MAAPLDLNIKFLDGTPAGVTRVVRDSAGRLSAWIENGWTMTVFRDAAGYPQYLDAYSTAGRMRQSFSWVGGQFVGSEGDTIPSRLIGELVGPAARMSEAQVVAAQALVTGYGKATATWTPAKLPAALWLAYGDLAAGAVASWQSRDTTLQASAQSTGSAQPTAGATGVTFDGGDFLTRDPQTAVYVASQTLPNGASNSDAGKGFTCTGLARQPDGSWWVANFGKKTEATSGSETFAASLVLMNAGFTSIQREILLEPLFPGCGGVQGVAYDTSDGTLWVASSGLNKILHLSTSGGAIGSISLAYEPNGLAYSAASDALWVNANSTDAFSLISKSGTVLKTGNIVLDSQDQLFCDDETNTLLCSYGANGSAGRVAVINTAGAAPVMTSSITLPSNADAIEGLYWDKAAGRLYVANDGYYHATSTALNAVQTYDISTPVSRVFTAWGVFSVSATTGTDAIFTLNNPIDTASSGVGLLAASTTELRVFLQSGASGTSSQVILSATGLTLTSFVIACFVVDMEANTVTLWINGTQVATASSAAFVGHVSQAGTLRIGAAADGGGRYPTMVMKELGYVMSAADREAIEGSAAHRYGLQGQLPRTHPYRFAAPV